MVLGFLGGLLANPIARGAGWLLGKASDWLSGTTRKVAESPMMQSFAQKVGPAVTNMVGADTFNNAMRQFGTTIQNKVENSRLKPVADGVNIGDAFYKGMTSIFDYLRNGGESNSSQTMGPTSTSVERGSAPSGSDAVNDVNMRAAE